MELPMYQIDAFTDRPFSGNPAAVCPLETWIEDSAMQNIAAENNLSETAFFVKNGDELKVKKTDDLFVMDFPSQPPVPCDAPADLMTSFDRKPTEVLKSADYLVIFEIEDDVRNCHPDFERLKNVDTRGIIVTAPGSKVDFVSRFFGPRVGINEDPVTGSSHCTLIPYWSKRLRKEKLHALQVSKRGGELFCEMQEDRVLIAGRCALYMKGTISL